MASNAFMNILACVISRVRRCDQRRLGAWILAVIDQGFISLTRARFGGNVGAQIADDISAFVDIGGRPGLPAAINEMRTHAFEREQRRGINIRLIDVLRVLRDELADHFEVAELFKRDILEHVTDGGILDMEGLNPILQVRR